MLNGDRDTANDVTKKGGEQECIVLLETFDLLKKKKKSASTPILKIRLTPILKIHYSVKTQSTENLWEFSLRSFDFKEEAYHCPVSGYTMFSTSKTSKVTHCI